VCTRFRLGARKTPVFCLQTRKIKLVTFFVELFLMFVIGAVLAYLATHIVNDEDERTACCRITWCVNDLPVVYEPEL